MGAETNAKNQAVTEFKYWGAWKAWASTVIAALISAYPTGMLLNVLQGDPANCADIGWVSCGNSWDPYTLVFGLLYAIPFWLGVFHFGFTDKKRWWYYILAVLFAKVLYVGADSLIYEVVAIGGGVIVGLTISVIRNKKAA